MAWDFETDPEYQELLDWADAFVREEVEPLDLVFPHLQFMPLDGKRREAVDPLKEQVRRQGLWATHLGPELGGQGYGQLKLALLNEILGRSQWAPIVFGCQAPDTGNAEIIAHYGTAEQKERYLRPLLDGETVLLLFDDRAAGRRRSHPVQDQRGTRRRRLGDQRLEVLLLQRQYGVVPDRDGGDQPRRQRLPGHVDVPGADRHTGRQHRPQHRPARRARRRGLTRADPLRQRARADRTRCSAARARRSSSRRPGSAAGGSTTRCAPSGWRRRRST